jgi:hypothetical protein
VADKMLELAEAEVTRLRAELEKTAAFRRLKAAEDLIATYRGNPEVEPARTGNAAELSQSSKDAVARVVEPIIRAHKTKTAMVESAAVQFLTQKGRRATSGEILPAVTAKGIAIPGKMPSKTISSYLSTSKRFDNIPGFGGYGLVEWNGRRTAPQSADAETAPTENTNGLFN